MREYNKRLLDKTCKELINNYLASVNFISRNQTPVDYKIFKDIDESSDFTFYANKQEKILYELVDEVLNPFIEYLLKYQGMSYYFCDYKDRNNAFEFIFAKNGIRYVVVYGSTAISDTDLMKITNSAKILYVSLSKLSGSSMCRGINRDSLSIEDLICKYFELSYFDYSDFAKSIKEAYKKACDILGLSIRQKISDYSMNDFNEVILKELKQDFVTNSNYVFYKHLDSDRGVKINRLDVDKDGNFSVVKDKFEKYCSCLCSKEMYATSFKTAEYMYYLFSEEESMDYTPVILGYIKSIEQLLGCVLEMMGFEILTRDANKNLKAETKATLANLIYTLRRHLPDIAEDVQFISESMLFYLSEFCKERNKYIHKNNIASKNTASMIRNNSRFLLFLMIGGLFRGKNEEEVRLILGISKTEEYDKFRNFVSKLDQNNEYITLYIKGEKHIATYSKAYNAKSKLVYLEDIFTKELLRFDENHFPEDYCYSVNVKERLKPDSGDIFNDDSLKQYLDENKTVRGLSKAYQIDYCFSFSSVNLNKHNPSHTNKATSERKNVIDDLSYDYFDREELENFIYSVNGDIDEAMEMYYDEGDYDTHYDVGIDDDFRWETAFCLKSDYEKTISKLKNKFIEYAKETVRVYNLLNKSKIRLKDENIVISNDDDEIFWQLFIENVNNDKRFFLQATINFKEIKCDISLCKPV